MPQPWCGSRGRSERKGEGLRLPAPPLCLLWWWVAGHVEELGGPPPPSKVALGHVLDDDLERAQVCAALKNHARQSGRFSRQIVDAMCSNRAGARAGARTNWAPPCRSRLSTFATKSNVSCHRGGDCPRGPPFSFTFQQGGQKGSGRPPRRRPVWCTGADQLPESARS